MKELQPISLEMSGGVGLEYNTKKLGDRQGASGSRRGKASFIQSLVLFKSMSDVLL